MIVRILKALVVAIAVGLLCLFAGLILDNLKVPIAVTVAGFLIAWGWVIGVLAGVWYFLTNGVMF